MLSNPKEKKTSAAFYGQQEEQNALRILNNFNNNNMYFKALSGNKKSDIRPYLFNRQSAEYEEIKEHDIEIKSKFTEGCDYAQTKAWICNESGRGKISLEMMEKNDKKLYSIFKNDIETLNEKININLQIAKDYPFNMEDKGTFYRIPEKTFKDLCKLHGDSYSKKLKKEAFKYCDNDITNNSKTEVRLYNIDPRNIEKYYVQKGAGAIVIGGHFYLLGKNETMYSLAKEYDIPVLSESIDKKATYLRLRLKCGYRFGISYKMNTKFLSPSPVRITNEEELAKIYTVYNKILTKSKNSI